MAKFSNVKPLLLHSIVISFGLPETYPKQISSDFNDFQYIYLDFKYSEYLFRVFGKIHI